MLLTVGALLAVMFGYLLMARNQYNAIEACVTCASGGCAHCTGGCSQCQCPWDPPGTNNCVCGSCGAACNGGCLSGSGDTTECACHSSACGCGNDATCRPECAVTCPCTPPSCPGGWHESGSPPGWRGDCEEDPDCNGTWRECTDCPDSRHCWKDEPTTQPALSNHMLYCFSGYPDSCVQLSQDPANPTIVYPPRPGGGGFIGMASVSAPNESRGMYYDMGLDDMASGMIYTYNGWDSSRYDEVTANVLSGHTYHAKGKDASLMRCVDRYWCAGDGDPWNGEGPCSEVHGYFRVTYPPTIDGVQVLMNSNIKCMLPPTLGGAPARWTGRYGLYPEVSNPIDLEVTVSDLDGWSDVDTVWLDIANTTIGTDFYCKNELINYVSVGLETELLSQGFDRAVKTEVASGDCQPNFCNSPLGVCGGECVWDPESNLTVPDTCNCKRNFVTNPFNPMNPRYNYDEPSCQLRYIPGVAAECHSCMAKPDHPDYQIMNVTRSVISATKVAYTFTIRFKDSYPEGIQQFYAMAQSGLLYSGIRDGGFQPRRTTNAAWTWGFDFHEPTGNIALTHVPDTPANQMQVTNNVADGVSGVRHLYDRRYWVMRGAALVGQGIVPLAEYWYSGEASITRTTSVDIPGLEGGDFVHSADIREDIACNINNTTASNMEVGPRWIQTLRKDVYGYLGFDDPIPLAGTALSQYWIGGGNSIANFGPSGGLSSLQIPPWYSRDYSDENRNGARAVAGLVPWYDELMGLALVSDWIDSHQNGMLRMINLSTDVPTVLSTAAETGIYVVDDMAGVVTIPSGTMCSGRKIIFLPGIDGNITLRMSPDFRAVDSNSACLFVVQNGIIKVDPGSDKANPLVPNPLVPCEPIQPACVGADYLTAAFITDGDIDVDNDQSFPRPDRLEIFGFVFSDSANFGRDMLWEDNWVRPTVLITYDPRYYKLLDDMLGRRPYSELECGIVKANASCENWVENP